MLLTANNRDVVRWSVLSIVLVLSANVGHGEEILPTPPAVIAVNPPVPHLEQAEGATQVLLDVKMVELDRVKLRELGVDFSQPHGNGSSTDSKFSNFTAGGSFQAKPLLGVIDALRENDLAKMLAEPTLVTMSGRPAKFSTETEIHRSARTGTSPVDKVKVGTRLDVVPNIVDGDQCTIELSLSWSGFVPHEHEWKVRRHALETAFRMRFGDTFVVATTTELTKPDGPEETTMLVLVTPKNISTEAAPARAAQRREIATPH